MAAIFTYSKSLTESLAKSGRPCMTPGAAKTLKNRVVVTILNIRIVQIQSVAQKSVELGDADCFAAVPLEREVMHRHHVCQ